ncbi:hypothetical protein STCU_12383 [Strigomonas culicis]|uniref:Uncharacterized protein n=1 Tax=Strigomonas culicis TaxID=28005 RepID=S9UK36_9TRYP|nr:hypothetical protein STCU_12383 [Strigomonas culicis]|eukprot:EPY15041.1 hypothetical protein STCU_12383 [Strigomonas culicis]
MGRGHVGDVKLRCVLRRKRQNALKQKEDGHVMQRRPRRRAIRHAEEHQRPQRLSQRVKQQAAGEVALDEVCVELASEKSEGRERQQHPYQQHEMDDMHLQQQQRRAARRLRLAPLLCSGLPATLAEPLLPPRLVRERRDRAVVLRPQRLQRALQLTHPLEQKQLQAIDVEWLLRLHVCRHPSMVASRRCTRRRVPRQACLLR